jgi:hypothetical protein
MDQSLSDLVHEFSDIRKRRAAFGDHETWSGSNRLTRSFWRSFDRCASSAGLGLDGSVGHHASGHLAARPSYQQRPTRRGVRGDSLVTIMAAA